MDERMRAEEGQRLPDSWRAMAIRGIAAHSKPSEALASKALCDTVNGNYY